MNRFRRITTTAEAADSRHTEIVPSVHQSFFYQRQQVAFAHQRVAQVQLVELSLTGTVVVQILTFFQPVDEEIIERTVYHKFERTQRVGYSFEEVTLSVGEVVHRISLPGSTCAVVRMLHDTIDDRVAEVHIRIGHVDFGTEYHSAFFYLTAVHLLEEFQAFFDWAVTVRAVHTCLRGSTFLLGNLFGCLLVDICFSFLDEADGEVP